MLSRQLCATFFLSMAAVVAGLQVASSSAAGTDIERQSGADQTAGSEWNPAETFEPATITILQHRETVTPEASVGAPGPEPLPAETWLETRFSIPALTSPDAKAGQKQVELRDDDDRDHNETDNATSEASDFCQPDARIDWPSEPALQHATQTGDTGGEHEVINSVPESTDLRQEYEHAIVESSVATPYEVPPTLVATPEESQQAVALTDDGALPPDDIVPTNQMAADLAAAIAAHATPPVDAPADHSLIETVDDHATRHSFDSVFPDDVFAKPVAPTTSLESRSSGATAAPAGLRGTDAYSEVRSGPAVSTVEQEADSRLEFEDFSDSQPDDPAPGPWRGETPVETTDSAFDGEADAAEADDVRTTAANSTDFLEVSEAWPQLGYETRRTILMLIQADRLSRSTKQP